MIRLVENISQPFSQGLKKLGFDGEVLLFLVNEKNVIDPLLTFHLETARDLGVTADVNGEHNSAIAIEYFIITKITGRFSRPMCFGSNIKRR